MSDRESAAYSERFRSNLQAGSGLLALVFVAIHFPDNVSYQILRDVLAGCNLLNRLIALYVSRKNTVQNFIFRKAVGILLVGAQLGRGWLDECILGYRSRQADLYAARVRNAS